MALQRRKTVVGIRFSKTERFKLQVEADKMGMSIAAFVRFILKKKRAI